MSAGQPLVYFALVSDLPLQLDPELATVLNEALDVEGKIVRALDSLGPIGGRDVVVVGGGPNERKRLEAAGARLTSVDPVGSDGERGWPLPNGSADAIVAAWSAFRGVEDDELAEADRVLRPGGRLLVLHDYGRDDVSQLRGDQPEYSLWSRRDGPFLSAGFKIRVLHCFWTFASIDVARRFLAEAFGEPGTAFGHALKRPRLSYNVALYHRSRGDVRA